MTVAERIYRLKSKPERFDEAFKNDFNGKITRFKSVIYLRFVFIDGSVIGARIYGLNVCSSKWQVEK